MNDQELIKDFIKIEKNPDCINFLVCQITWDLHTPISKWKIAAKTPADISSTAIKQQIAQILNNQRYFNICQECGERNPCGWMHDQHICQSCAENNHGVLY